MNYKIYTDLKSPYFIRCAVSIPGLLGMAGGASFTLSGAVEKCRSEAIERSFFLKLQESEDFEDIGMDTWTCKEGLSRVDIEIWDKIRTPFYHRRKLDFLSTDSACL